MITKQKKKKTWDFLKIFGDRFNFCKQQQTKNIPKPNNNKQK